MADVKVRFFNPEIIKMFFFLNKFFKIVSKVEIRVKNKFSHND